MMREGITVPMKVCLATDLYANIYNVFRERLGISTVCYMRKSYFQYVEKIGLSLKTEFETILLNFSIHLPIGGDLLKKTLQL